MGLIARLLGLSKATSEIGAAVSNVAEVFTPNATKKMQASFAAYQAALAQFDGEFSVPRPGFFDRIVNGLNRLPRPAMALGTIGLFVYAMVSPTAFSERMQGLAFVPEPLWWLLGAVVSFYFGAREMSYVRGNAPVSPFIPKPPKPSNPQQPTHAISALGSAKNATVNSPVIAAGNTANNTENNAALAEWQRGRAD